jgi:streptogramin lyase
MSSRFKSVAGGLALMLIARISSAQSFAEYPINPYVGFGGIASGPDGNLWFTEILNATIGRITPGGVVTEFPGSHGQTIDIYGQPIAMTAGPDGNMWFSESGGVGRITMAGAITRFPLPGAYQLSPFAGVGIAAGADGNIWYSDAYNNTIWRVTVAGGITGYPIPTQIDQGPFFPPTSGPGSIVAGPDGNLWFPETAGNKIARVTTAGVITEFPVPTPNSVSGGITSGPDAQLWFTENAKIGRIATDGVMTEIPLPAGASAENITVGPDGNLWFTEGSSKIGRITTGGVVAEFPITFDVQPGSITAGPDGNLWFTTSRGLGRMTTAPDTLCLNESRFCVQVAWQATPSSNGLGIAVPITTNTGAFWFFETDNLELVVKILDGRAVDGHFWVFYGSLTNVEFTLTVTDTQTGAVKTYFNPQGRLASVADTSAF